MHVFVSAKKESCRKYDEERERELERERDDPKSGERAHPQCGGGLSLLKGQNVYKNELGPIHTHK